MTSPIVPTGPETPDASAPTGRAPGEPDGVTPHDGSHEDREGPVDTPTPQRRRWLRWLAFGIVPLALLVAAAFLVELPYYLVQPGSVRPSGTRIDVTGARSYDDEGALMFTTVLMSRATPALMVRAVLDDAVEVRSEEELYPGGDIEETRRENLQRMDLSKLIATKAALEYLGIEASFDADGAKVLGLLEESPSEGLLQPGDVIVGVDGGEVGMPTDIAQELSDRKPGDEVLVEVVRAVGEDDPSAGDPEEVSIVLGSADDGEGSVRPVLGIEVEPQDPVVDSPVQVRVDSGEVSGPSAGLAWTLGIIDRLTPGSLTQGKRIAVTGEVFEDGSVGAVGGVVQKVAAVKRAGIGVFIFPAATPEHEQREMRRVAGDDLTLQPVESVSEAVEMLAPGGVRRPD